MPNEQKNFQKQIVDFNNELNHINNALVKAKTESEVEKAIVPFYTLMKKVSNTVENAICGEVISDQDAELLKQKISEKAQKLLTRHVGEDYELLLFSTYQHTAEVLTEILLLLDDNSEPLIDICKHYFETETKIAAIQYYAPKIYNALTDISLQVQKKLTARIIEDGRAGVHDPRIKALLKNFEILDQ